MGLQNDIEELKTRCRKEYDEYKNFAGDMINEYNYNCSRFDSIIGTINNQRLELRHEIQILFNFLKSMGGALNEEKPISVFEFVDEEPAPNQFYSEMTSLQEPNFKEIEGWDFLCKGLVGISIDYFKNKEMYKNFLVSVEQRKADYDKDLADRVTRTAYLEDAIKIAEIYRNIIVIVKDTVSKKIIPELELIESFLYADAIRERIMDGGNFEDIQPCVISEYMDTKQDIHYQFVKNSFDFYLVCTNFFKKAILTEILEDKIVSNDEKKLFLNK